MWRRAFVAASVSWSVALPLAAFAVTRSHAGTAVYMLAFAVYTIGGAVCHQLPARSFHVWSAPLPVCARCTGIYVGAAVASLLAGTLTERLNPRTASIVGRAERGRFVVPGTLSRPADARTLLLLAAIPSAATLLYEWTTGNTPGNWVRALAGLPIGGMVAAVLMSACGHSAGAGDRDASPRAVAAPRSSEDDEVN